MPTPRFDWSFNLGHLITIGTVIIPFFAWIVLSNGNFDRRITVVESALHTIAETVSQNDARLREAIAAIDQRNRELDADIKTSLRRLFDLVLASRLAMPPQNPYSPPVVPPAPTPEPARTR